jgi:hypothetical protein
MQSVAISAEWQAADSAEESTIEKLRNALIMATDAPGNDLATNAPWVTQRFMIDAQESSCRKITRIEQAIETLQGILLEARTGQAGHAYVDASGPVTAVERTARDLFVVGSDGAVYTNRRDPTANDGLWTGWYMIAGEAFRVPLGSTVTSVARDAGHIDLFVVGNDGDVYANTWDTTNGWRNWRSLYFRAPGRSVPQKSVVTALARDASHLDIFVVGSDGGVYTDAWDAATGIWQGWQPVGSPSLAPPLSVIGAVSFAGTMDIFVVGNEIDGRGHGAVNTNHWNGSWQGWTTVGDRNKDENLFPVRSVVTVCSRSVLSMNIFVVGKDADGRGHGAVFTSSWNREVAFRPWSNWTPIGDPRAGQTVPLRSVVSAVARNPNAMDIFVVGNEGGIWSNGFDGNWGGWYPIGRIDSGEVVPPNSVVAAASSWELSIDLYVVGFDHEVYTNSWNVLPSAHWSGWLRVGDRFPTLDAPHFEEEWKWIGTYGSWRSAMLVWTWPENIFNPTLRRWETPAFRTLVATIRGSSPLTREQACAAACTYADYFQDVCTLTIEAACLARTQLNQPQGCACGGPFGPEELWYFFGRGRATNGVYWSTLNEHDVSGYAQSFWDLVPGLARVSVVKLIGVTRYIIKDQRYVPPQGRPLVSVSLRGRPERRFPGLGADALRPENSTMGTGQSSTLSARTFPDI